ncbi:hypothetical protein Pelo_18784 [Pelomyxa schiedti]|nr:hypothetical protein Pelo_18784 [Pelomyxa schiedti]
MIGATVQIYSGTNNPTLPFGDIDQLFTGDFQQYSPALQVPLYRRTQQVGETQRGILLWQQIKLVFRLQVTHRFNNASYGTFISRLCCATVLEIGQRTAELTKQTWNSSHKPHIEALEEKYHVAVTMAGSSKRGNVWAHPL